MQTGKQYGYVAGNHNLIKYFETHEEAMLWAKDNTFGIPTFVAQVTHTLIRPATKVFKIGDKNG